MKKHAAPIIAVILLLLPMLYVGSYLALVKPGGVMIFSDTVVNGNLIRTSRKGHYLFGDRVAKVFFRPLEQVDRQMRPADWDESP